MIITIARDGINSHFRLIVSRPVVRDVTPSTSTIAVNNTRSISLSVSQFDGRYETLKFFVRPSVRVRPTRFENHVVLLVSCFTPVRACVRVARQGERRITVAEV